MAREAQSRARTSHDLTAPPLQAQSSSSSSEDEAPSRQGSSTTSLRDTLRRFSVGGRNFISRAVDGHAPASSARQSASHPTAVTTMPHAHRENTPLHALRDTFIRPDPTSPESVDVEAAFANLRGYVLVLGGYRGSTLRDAKTQQRLWLPLKTGLNVRTPDLSLGLDDEAELRAHETILPDHMISAVLGVVDLGKRLKEKLKALHANGQIRFINFGYDWRISLDISSARLLARLEELYEQTGETTTVIAHSMGGLVALHAIARAADPSVVKRFIAAGTPWQGCVNVLGPLGRGDAVMRNRTICSPQAVFSMRSSFAMLGPGMACFETPAGVPIPLDWTSVEAWSTHAMSPVTDGVLGSLRRSSNGEDTGRMLARASATEAALDEEGDEDMPPIAPSLSRQSSLIADDMHVGPGQLGGGGGGTPPSSAKSGVLANALKPIRNRLGAVTSDLKPSTAVKSAVVPSDREIVDYLGRTLDRAARFRADLTDLFDPTKAERYPPIVLLVSGKTPTVRGALVDSADRIRDRDFSRLLYADGDGIVLHESASNLPGPWRPRATISSNFGHVSLLGDLPSIAKALSA